MKIHPNDVVLEEFLLSLNSEHRSLLDHVVRCAVCRARLRYLPRHLEPAAGVHGHGSEMTASYGAALERAAGRLEGLSLRLARERDEAPGLYVALTEMPPEKRDLLFRNSTRFHTWGLLELLVERSLEVTTRDAEGAEALGHMALRLSDHLDSDQYGRDLIEDMRARAWAHIGNARRVRSDLQGAEEAFQRASSHLENGTQDPLEQAISFDLQASLLRDQRRFGEALQLLRRGVAICLKTGELHRAGRTLVNLSYVHWSAGRLEKAIPALYRALELLDPAQEPRLLLCARHNLILYLADLDRFTEAWSLYRESRQLYQQFPDAWTQNRRRWVKGKMARGLAQFAQAESLFLAARDGFVSEGIPYDTALVSLELATLYAEQGRTADLKRLAEEMVLIFASRQIHREALAALAFLKQAAEAERASLAIVSEIAAYLRRAQHDPELRFEAPS